MLTSLAPRIFHLWILRPTEPACSQLHTSVGRIVSTEEVARSNDFVRGGVRDRYLIRRAFVRTVLSQYTQVDPADWTFGSGPYGKPEVVTPKAEIPLFFSLSSCEGIIACLIGSDRKLGLDIERWDPSIDVDPIADHYLTPSEAQFLHKLPSGERSQAFLKLWTLKEAYLKALGVGLSLPTETFMFSDKATEIELSSALGQWCFRVATPDSQHIASIALPRLATERDDDWRAHLATEVKVA